MDKVNNFDPEKYKELLEKLGKCRKSIRSTTFYEGLSCIVPGGYISMDLRMLLEKWCATNPSGSWGSCYKTAREIRELLFRSDR